MQLFAASVAEAAESFLHAGYISAYPRTLMHLPSGEPKLQLDVTEALRLEGETLAAASQASDTTAAAITAAGPWFQVLLGAALVCGALLAWLLLRDRVGAATRRWMPAVASLAVVVAFVACEAKISLPTVPPWQGVAVQKYANPQQATVALLNGIVADGIVNVGAEIDSLANIQNEVGLPKKKLTQGETYALKTYGLDGWGKELRLAKTEAAKGEESAKYAVTSAGADGAFDTADDVSLSVQQGTDSNWDSNRWGFFVNDATPTVLFHRWTGKHFRYTDATAAEAIAGSQKFDVASKEALSSASTGLTTRYQQASTGLAHKPLLLLVY